MEPPTEKVIQMKKEGKPEDEIRRTLETEGYNQQQILEALNQAEIKQGVNSQREENFQGTAGMEESALSQEPDIPVPSPTGQEATPRAQYLQQVQQPQIQIPQMQQYPMAQEQMIQEVVESVVDEKWHQFMANFGDLTVWKNRTDDDIAAVKQEIIRSQQRLENLQTSIVGKVEEYNQNISKVSTELQAMEKVFEKILQPLTENIRELSKIKDELTRK